MQKYYFTGLGNPVEAKSFIHMDESAIHDPYLLHDMEKAVTLIKAAIQTKRK